VNGQVKMMKMKIRAINESIAGFFLLLLLLLKCQVLLKINFMLIADEKED
jgi:hypothetical protein